MNRSTVVTLIASCLALAPPAATPAAIPAATLDAAEEGKRRNPRNARQGDPSPQHGAPGEEATRSLSGRLPIALAAADWNRDGHMDIVATYPYGSGSLIALVDGTSITAVDGRPYQPRVIAQVAGHAGWLAPGDLDADGLPDIVTADLSEGVIRWLPAANDFARTETITYRAPLDSVVLSDMARKDGLADLAVAVRAPSGPRLAIRFGPVVSNAEVRLSLPGPILSMAVADSDRDGRAEIEATTTSGRLLVRFDGARRPIPDSMETPDRTNTTSRQGGYGISPIFRSPPSQAPRVAPTITAHLRGHALPETITATEAGITVRGAMAAATFTVDSNGDLGDLTPGDGVCATTTGECTLRAALQEANSTAGADTINFSIGTGPRILSPTGPLPVITDPLLLDATTQPGYAGAPLIELSGTLAGAAVSGLSVASDSVTIQGIAVTGFDGDGIDITGNGNVIRLSYIGTDGATPKPNGAMGIFVENGSNNLIGGVGGGNVISGNGTDGIDIVGATATGNRVEGNLIGTDATGTAAMPNTFFGIFVDATDSAIGGTAAGAGNLVSGNGEAGIIIRDQRDGAKLNRIQGNTIGLDISGQQSMGNAAEGILIREANQNTIGGPTPAARNVVAANLTGGIFVRGKNGSGSGNIIAGNYIGTSQDGQSGRGNLFDGIFVRDAPSTTIGGAIPNAGNVIAASGAAGIYLLGGDTTGSLIQGNTIGTAADGLTPLGNTDAGVTLDGAGSNQVISNTITASGGAGLLVTSGAVNNLFSQNSLSANGGLAIDLAPAPPGDGVTANDPLDADTGSNALQNFPVLSSATICQSQMNTTGTLASTPSSSYTIEFYSSPSCDPSGHGEAVTYVGSTVTTTDASGLASFAASFPLPVQGTFITATATDASGNSSELSSCINLIDNRPGEALALTFLTKESLSFTAAANAASHLLHRGDPGSLPALLDGSQDSCIRHQGPGTTITGLTETPPAGSFFWYIVVGENGCGPGPAGNGRSMEAAGPCP